MRPIEEADSAPMKPFVGYVWIGDEPGVRLRLSARSAEEALATVEAKYGKGHVVSVWNEDDAYKPR